MVRNESVRFGRHIDIEVRYKILHLELPKNVPNLQNSPCFSRGCFEAIFVKNTPRCLGVKHPQVQHASTPIGCLKELLNCHWLLLIISVGIANMLCRNCKHVVSRFVLKVGVAE
jgi:hypothetical protein